MNDKETKEAALNELYNEFEMIKWILNKADVKMKRILKLKELLAKLENTHINKIKSSHTWLHNFIALYIKPWKLIRSENTEAIWDGYIARGFGNEFPEIKELNRCSKAIRLNWVNRHNILLKEKKVEDKGKTVSGT